MGDDAPSSPRHFFYTPQAQSTKTLTGYKAQDNHHCPEDPEETVITFSDDDMENHEPYRDDEEEERGGGLGGEIRSFNDSIGGNGSCSIPPPPTMKPMSVSTGEDYGNNDENSTVTQRKACFAAMVSVCFLILGYWLTIGHESSSSFSSNNHNHNHESHSSSSGGGGGGGNSGHKKPEISQCAKDGYDANYFTLLLEKVEQWNQTQQCTTEFPIHDCKCHNPFLPLVQDQHPGWLDIVRMNSDLIHKNYTDRGLQPEVVIYGDSITEHTVGRHFGRYLDKYSKHAQITQKLLTKRGRGHINGLPLGIAADHMAHLLYRLQNGEMPEVLTPKFWWLLIGTNDVGFGCSIETVVAGNIRLVKEIRERHNNQHGHKTLTPVVMNSILPRGKFELHSDQSPYRIIYRINQQLDCYAQLTEGVYFVNVTDAMTETFPTNGSYLKEGYFAGDNLHPSPIGTQQWEEIIVSQVMQFMT